MEELNQKKQEKVDQGKNFLKGILTENPTFAMFLGMCPTLAVTKTLESALGMGMCILFVLVLSNLIISLIKDLVPESIRIPVYIVVIASLVCIVEMVLQAFLPDLYTQLGAFVSLIVVNCIILGRAEAFASKHDPLSSIIDGVGMALGFTLAIVIISLVREILGNATLTVWGSLKFDLSGVFAFLHLEPIKFLQSNPGAFLTLGLLAGIITTIRFAIQNKKNGGNK